MNEIIEMMIKFAGTLVGVALFLLLKNVSTYVKSRLDANEEALLNDFVTSLVAAAEQMFKTESGAVRLSYVQDQLIDAGYELTDALRALIESKVYEINLGDDLNE